MLEAREKDMKKNYTTAQFNDFKPLTENSNGLNIRMKVTCVHTARRKVVVKFSGKHDYFSCNRNFISLNMLLERYGMSGVNPSSIIFISTILAFRLAKSNFGSKLSPTKLFVELKILGNHLPKQKWRRKFYKM